MSEKIQKESKPQERESVGRYSENGKDYEIFRFSAAGQGVAGEGGVFEVVYEMTDKGWAQKPFGQCEIMREYQDGGTPMRVVRFKRQLDSGAFLPRTDEEVAENKPREREMSVHVFEAVQKREGDRWVIVSGTEKDLTLEKENKLQQGRYKKITKWPRSRKKE